MSEGSSPEKSRRPIHALRILILCGVLLMLRLHHEKAQSLISHETPPIPIESVREALPNASELAANPNATGGYSVLSAEGAQVGVVMQTSPAADHIVGFSGPTNVLLIFDNDETLVRAEILSSQDTPNHVQAILDEPAFLERLEGMSKSDLATPGSVDGISGATLTSVAIRESIVYRLGGIRTSLRFPNDPALDQAQILFPDAAALEESDKAWDVLDSQGARIGALYRTSPTSDGIVGYQGPTDTLIGLDTEGRVIGFAPAQTYDNEEYVYYVRVDEYFREILNGKTLAELAEIDLKAAEVEGVSGATMTSMAMARGVVARAQALTKAEDPIPSETPGMTLEISDILSMLIIAFGVVMGLSKLRSRTWLRVAFSVALVVQLGLLSGEMLSLAMFAGWTRHGIPWTTAPTLVLLSLAAVLLPVASGRNLYCHHLCPHGAVQQMIRRLPVKDLRLSARSTRILKHLRGVLLAVCGILAFAVPGFSLVHLEAFDAWVWNVAGWAAISIAIVGLAASFVIPMAYCRFGCPTGYLLDLLRRHRRSDRWSTADWAASSVLAASFVAWIAL